MILKELKDISKYSQLAEQHLGVFASERWLSVYGNELKLVGIFKDDDQLIGGFYYFDTRKFGLRFIKLPPYTPYCGLFFLSESTNRSSRNGFTKEVLLEVCKYLISLKSALTILAVPPTVVDMQTFIWQKFKIIPNYTYRINLENELSVITANFDSKNRNVINKAIKDGVSISENDLEPNQLFDFYYSTLKEAGANVYESELKNIFRVMSDFSASFCMTARVGSELAGVVYCVFDKTSCYYLLGGIDRKQKIQGVNNLLILKCIEKAKSLNCSIFDFEGSMIPGVEKFFRSFGPELVPYYTMNKAWKPLELLLKFKKPEIF